MAPATRNRLALLFIAVAAALAVIWLVRRSQTFPVYYVNRAAVPPPISVIVRSSNNPVRVFANPGGAFLILPDGSLWAWGSTVSYGGPARPEPVETNRSWTLARAASEHCVAIDSQGRLWGWGRNLGYSSLATNGEPTRFSAPVPLDSRTGWVSVAAGRDHEVALRNDGSLWAWGDGSSGQLGNGLGPRETNDLVVPNASRTINGMILPMIEHERQTQLVQVGTNSDWRSVSSGTQDYSLAIRADGTLWMWGKVWSFFNRHPGEIFEIPTQVCRETNWVWVEADCVINNKGEAWMPLLAPPSPAAPVSATCVLLASNCERGRFARGRELFQLRKDGTLWATELKYTERPLAIKPTGSRRVGNRSDWISVEGCWGLMFGTTADGTLWTWGYDPSLPPVVLMRSRLDALKRRVQGWFNLPSASSSSTTLSVPVIQRDPRPLMRINLETGGTRSSTSGNQP